MYQARLSFVIALELGTSPIKPTPTLLSCKNNNNNNHHVFRPLLDSVLEDVDMPMLFYFISNSNDSPLSPR
jgi:hypothetical protein